MEMNYNLYALFDKVSGTVTNTFIALNDGLAVRETLLTLRVPIRDSQIYQIGTFVQNLDKDKISVFDLSCHFSVNPNYRLVSWDSYRFPENVAEALAPLGCSPDEVAEISKNRIKSEVNNG